jgi:hypothetical protein
MKKILLIVFITVSFLDTYAQTDPLPSWNEGALKTSIINYVKEVTTEGGDKFVPIADRIATFDNDGTLWAEIPLIQGLFIKYLIKGMLEKKPALREKQPYKAMVEKDTAYLHKLTERDVIGLMLTTHTGTSEAEFEKQVKDFFATATTANGTPVSKLVYQPQVELLNYLRANGFKTFICSGGTIEFVRVISMQYYGIPPEQVMGTKFKYVYKDTAKVNDLVRQPSIVSFNDKQEKPVNIQYHVGKRPIFACGNERSGGDIYMLRFSQGSAYPSFQLLVNHDDKDREYYYQEKDNISLNWAKKYNWNVVSIKDDWKEVFVR